MRRPAADAEELLAALEADSFSRLKWRVLALLGESPLSLRARLMTRRQVLRCACHLALDLPPRVPEANAPGENPNFDMARFRALGGMNGGV